MSKKELTKNSATVFAATFINSASAFIFLLMMGRSMGMGDFGALNALLSIQLIFSVFTGALILVYAKYTAQFLALQLPGKVWGFYSLSWSLALLCAFLSVLLVAGSSVLWKESLNIDSFGVILITGTLIGSYFLQAVPLGFVRGMEKFGILAIGLSISGLLRLALAAIFIAIGITVGKAISALFLSVIVSIAIMHIAISSHQKDVEPERPNVGRHEMLSFYIKAVIAGFFPLFFINVDIILVRLLFSPEESGIYSAFATIGKTIFVTALVVSAALFPAAVRGKILNSANSIELFKRASFMLFGVGAVVTLFSYFWSDDIMRLLFRVDDKAVSSLLPYYCVAVWAVSFLLMEFNYSLASGGRKFLLLALAVTALQLPGIFYFSDSLEKLIMFQMTLFMTVAVVRFVAVMFRERTA